MYVDVGGNKTYFYTGSRPFNAELPSIVFIHGAGSDHTVWVLQSRYFAHHGYNALAVDMPGHGRSAGEVRASLAGYGDWIAAFLDALAVSQASMVGHSMGSLIALEVAARHPQRVSKLALIGVSTPMAVTDTLLSAAEENDHGAFDMINIWGHALGQIGGHQAPGMWMMGGAVRLLERSGRGVLHNDLKACNDYQDGVASGGAVACPTLLLVGEEDMMAPPRRAAELAKTIADARVKQIESCGHMLMGERPEEVLDALIEHIVVAA